MIFGFCRIPRQLDLRFGGKEMTGRKQGADRWFEDVQFEIMNRATTKFRRT